MLRVGLQSLRSAVSLRTATTAASAITRVPLNEALPGFDSSSDSCIAKGKHHEGDPFDAQLTTLENGLKVASQPAHGDFVTIGVAIESGCRFEAEHRKGVSHFLEKLAFQSTARQSKKEIFDMFDRSSAIVDCQSTRFARFTIDPEDAGYSGTKANGISAQDTTIFAASCHRSCAGEILGIIADSALRPSLDEDEIDIARSTVISENDEMRVRIEGIEPLLHDWLHTAGFRNNTLGNSKFASDENAMKMTRDDLLRFLRAHHTTKRMTVSGVGVDHKELVGFSQRFFVERTDPIPNGTPPIDESRAQYTGGEIRLKADLSRVGAGTPYPLLAHLSLGFEGVGYKDEDFVVFCVLQSLLGGGNSFSAGGPGKGMYSRCYVDVLNHHHWMYGCNAMNFSYADAGMFAVQTSAPPDTIGFALQIVLDLIFRITVEADFEELSRAKTQLKSQLLMNMEMRSVMFEDMARQVMGHGYRRKPWEYIAAIDKVTEKDIIQAGERLLSSRPTLVAYGNVDAVASYDQLDEAVAKRDVRLIAPKKKFFSFQ